MSAGSAHAQSVICSVPIHPGGWRIGNSQTAEFTPIASYPGLTADVRARLGEMKVAPVGAEMIADTPLPEVRDIAPPVSAMPKAAAPKAKRAELR